MTTGAMQLQPQKLASAAAAESTRGVPVYVPLTDIYESESGLVMLLEVPGADIDSTSVTVDKGVLRITAHTRADAPTGYTLTHQEYRGGDYERSFTLSDAIDADSVKAVMKDGVLRIELSKAGPALARRVSVSAG